jgi:integral membrane protein
MEKALARFKFIAYLAGIVLILFTIEIVLKYSGILEIPWFAQLHGIVYMVYVVIAFDMSRRAKLSLRDTFLVLIAGTIPVMSFIAESKIRRRVINS